MRKAGAKESTDIGCNGLEPMGMQVELYVVPNGMNLQAAVNHELGHLLGFDHYDAFDVMRATLSPSPLVGQRADLALASLGLDVPLNLSLQRLQLPATASGYQRGYSLLELQKRTDMSVGSSDNQDEALAVAFAEEADFSQAYDSLVDKLVRREITDVELDSALDGLLEGIFEVKLID